MRTLILGYGNPGRGDDGLGPALVERLEFHGVAAVLETAMQLQPEHIFDLAACGRALLVDTGTGTPAPFTFEPLVPRRDASFTTHALSPWMLLALYEETLRRPPPPAFLLTIRGERFGLGEALSPAAVAHLGQAETFVHRWLADARAVPG
ncbi:hypothetical protein MIN45_P2023 [Methylomarinovum tepidoasis]|uniref:Hydrogenase maturation protease n=1 Tax=Methylomarinovum tepidoasis TaxID=2840183 RepID=A0AAU9CY61_9GAMM|nr:hydrogenase maturation protease [Methylomarinovum sp. IN45]BCX89650.1 hypothetical protein MIN45_P2023 [Methylomarinovum sp. IN45]